MWCLNASPHEEETTVDSSWSREGPLFWRSDYWYLSQAMGEGLPFILLLTPLFVTVIQTAICINRYCVFHFKTPVHFHKNNVYNFMHRETSWCKIGSINRLSYLKRMISVWSIHLALSQFPYLVTFFLLFFSFYVIL